MPDHALDAVLPWQLRFHAWIFRVKHLALSFVLLVRRPILLLVQELILCRQEVHLA